ncbi:transposase [Sphingomonas alpina]|uniref:Transposase n=1 Tax=Sphingomonas alpina TaxID=653931 RepID=A0A7H0LP37_9SPHN|nr:transposase [Sphingomonas alpina]
MKFAPAERSCGCTGGESLATARRITEAWRTNYNNVRPHSSLGGLAPAEFTNRPRRGHMDTEANLSAA